jgi:S-adenosylmethionine decarboxylase
MRDIAPEIVRKRLVIEANFSITFTREIVSDFLLGLAKHLELRTYGDPIIHSLGGEGREENQGFDAFVPLIDSGISLYVWSNAKFLSCVLYTCKDFSTEKAVSFVKDFAKTTDLVHEEF